MVECEKAGFVYGYYARRRTIMARKIKRHGRMTVIVIAVIMTLTAAAAVLCTAAIEDHKYYSEPGYMGQYNRADAEHSVFGRLADIEIELSIGGSTEKLTFDEIGDWVTAKKTEKGFSYSVSDERIAEYAEMLDKKYSNYRSYITFSNINGSEMTLENKGMGWIFDPDHAKAMLKEHIENAVSLKLDLTDRSEESNKWWLRRVSDYAAVKNENGIVAEVSVDDQYMWVRKNDEVILESPVVTGNPGTGNDTPKGAYTVYEKKSPSVLYGADYNTEVAYWIAFNDDIGFHDASWQSEFGGTVYLSNGSHGCVNMPLDAVKKLYDIAYTGMHVYVY